MDEEISVPMHSSWSVPESVIWTCQGQNFAADPSLLMTFYGFEKLFPSKDEKIFSSTV